jgi:hypothetical protein
VPQGVALALIASYVKGFVGEMLTGLERAHDPSLK